MNTMVGVPPKETNAFRGQNDAEREALLGSTARTSSSSSDDNNNESVVAWAQAAKHHAHPIAAMDSIALKDLVLAQRNAAECREASEEIQSSAVQPASNIA